MQIVYLGDTIPTLNNKWREYDYCLFFKYKKNKTWVITPENLLLKIKWNVFCMLWMLKVIDIWKTSPKRLFHVKDVWETLYKHITARFSKVLWTTKPKADYHPNHFSARSVVDSFFLIICARVVQCTEGLA